MKNILLIILLFCFSKYAFTQTTVVLQASKDNTIYNESGNSNGVGPNFTCGVNSSGSIRRALIKFDLSTIPPGATITSVTLTLTLTKSKTGTDKVSLYKLSQDWGEGTSDAGDPDGQGTIATLNDATWNCSFYNGVGGCTVAWATPGGVFESIESASTFVANSSTTNTWSSSQMKTDVQGWVSNSSSNFGWIIRAGVVGGSESGLRTTNRFASKDNPNGSITPKLSVTYIGGAAPVTLSKFNASETKQGVLLNWQTSSEYNNAYFSVEYSTDGVIFSSIGKVKGSGSSTLVHDYQFTHQGISEGKHFYRLAQTDFDGSSHTSSIISVISKNRHLQISISPNPVKNMITLGGIVITPSTTYSIINSSGVIVQKGSLQSIQIITDGLANGFYMLRINKPGSKTLSGLFLKQ